MRFFSFKLLLFLGLFIAMVVKGGELFSVDGVQAMTRMTERERAPAVEPLPVRPIEEEFRGVSPLPALTEKSGVVRKIDKPARFALKKSSKPTAQAKDSRKNQTVRN